MNNDLTLKPITVNSFVCLDTPEINDDYSTFLTFLQKHHNDSGFVIAYLDYKVLIGKFAGELTFWEREKFEPKYLQRLRLFNENRELLIWKSGQNGYKSRLRVDGGDQGREEHAVEAEQVLWGTRGEKCEEGWTRLSEERGMDFVLPIDATQVNNHARRVKLKTINYIAYNELGQAGYYDCRFVNFFVGGV
ncbi:MAG: hypothetical protein DDT32_00638 [Syntrophomonadaceae bacterium]|nr:hypothetical protein [Bacillota bacterium]